MQNANKRFQSALIGFIYLLLVGLVMTARAQERITIQANAMGTSTQMGRLFPVKIIIEQVSTPADQKVLITAFKRSGQDGLRSALEDMSQRGRISLEGRVGNDVKYIRELPSKEGRRFRLVTDRNIAFGELRAGTRSSEYDIGAVELTITPDGTGSGPLLPACKLKFNKKTKEIEIETYQNPWNLTNFIVHKGE